MPLHLVSSIFNIPDLSTKNIFQIAYRTFHSIAVSGRFDALHLDDEDAVDQITESKDPILVNESLFSSRNYNDDYPISRSRILQSLKVSGSKILFVSSEKLSGLVWCQRNNSSRNHWNSEV